MKTKKKILSVLAAVLIGLNPARGFEAGGIAYSVVEGNSVACEVTYLEEGTYSGELTIPGRVENGGVVYTVTGVGEYAFSGSENLTSVTLPASATRVGRNAFYGCVGLTKVSGTGVTEVEKSAFSGCGSLADLQLSSNILSIGESAFRNCRQITGFDMTKTSSLGEGAFYGCEKLKTVKLPAAMTALPAYTFSGCTSLAEVRGLENVAEIGDYAFYTCTALEEPGIMRGFGSIGKNAFGLCTSLKTLDLLGNDGIVGEYAFAGCTALESVNLQGITEIEAEAFGGCTALDFVCFGEATKIIRERAFGNCPAITRVKCESEQPPLAANLAFMTETYETALLVVPDTKYNLYRQIYPWTYFNHCQEADVDKLEAETGECTVTAEGGLLRIKGRATGPVTVCTADGRVIGSAKKTESDIELPLNTRGIIIVRINERTIKIIN